jgi:uncharacterized protein (DUF305 family)
MRKFGIFLATLLSFSLLSPTAIAATPKIGPSETMFAQEMIPHHQQAVTMAKLAIKYSQNKSVLAIAKKIQAEQSPEIAQMQSWLVRAGLTVSGMHGMDMGNSRMLTTKQLSALGASRGKNFDRLFLQGMIGHHQGAIQMAALIADSPVAEAKILYRNIVRVQTAEIAQMKSLLTQIGR